MLCYSTGSLPNVPLTEVLELYPARLFPGVELVITPQMLEFYQDEKYWEEIKDKIKELGLYLRSIHLGHPLLASDIPHFPGLASSNKAESREKLDVVFRCIEIAEMLEPHKFTITTGVRPEGEIEMPALMNLYVSIDKILKKLNGKIQLGFEQEPEHVIHSTEQILALCRRFEGELFATFDIGHSQVLGEDIPESIRILAAYISNIHFEDIQSRVHRHLLFGEGDLPFAYVIKAIEEIHYSGDLTPDLYPFAEDHQRAMKASADFFKKYGLISG